MTITKLARPEIQSLQPYKAAVQVDDMLRLNANEAPWRNSVEHFLRPLNRYPEIRPGELRNALARRFACKQEQLLVTRGTSEAIDLLIRAFCRAGLDTIATTSPTFSMYRHYADIQGAIVREVTTSGDQDFAIDVDALLDLCDASTRLIFVCSPNNPTGTVLPRADLINLLERRGDLSLVVVDEAYIEFADNASATELLDAYGNLIVLRTLSKALAFAGARCGAAIGPAAVIQMLDAIQAPYAIATPVVECVLDALQEDRMLEVESRLQKIVSERERMIAAVRQYSFVRKVWPSCANFYLIQLDNVDLVLQQSERDKVLLRYFGGALDDCIRITVGSPEENDRLLQTFDAIQDNRE